MMHVFQEYSKSLQHATYPISLLTEAEETQIIKIANISANVLSLLGCVFNLFTTFLLRASNRTIATMVIGLSVLDMLNNITSLIAVTMTYPSNAICQIVTFFEYFGYSGALVLTCCFAHSLYIGIKGVGPQSLDNYLKIYLILTGIAGLILASYAVISEYDKVDPKSGFCWHYHGGQGFDWEDLIISTLPLAMSIIYCIYCYISVIRHLKSIVGRDFLELLLYPVILIVCYLPWVSWAIYQSFITMDKMPFAWLLMAAIGSNSQGLFNAFAYGLSRRIVQGYNVKCCKKRHEREVPLMDSVSETPDSPFISAHTSIANSGEMLRNGSWMETRHTSSNETKRESNYVI